MMRKPVAPPLVTPPAYTLLDYVQWVDDPDPHWRAGITYQPVCGATATTFDFCTVTGSGELPNPTKSPTAFMDGRGATPFTVYAEIDCSPPGFWDDAGSMVAAQLARTESFDVEQVFWTGIVAGVASKQFPHLAANAVVTDPQQAGPFGVEIIMQTAASVAATGTFDAVEGLGKLEQFLAECYVGVGLIYVTIPVFEDLVANLLVTRQGARWQTAKGNWVVPGRGFTGSGPDGAPPASGTAWAYVTGALMGYRSPPKQVGSATESFDKQVNLLKMIVERTYVLGWDCCHGAVLFSTGGVITGTANSAT